MSTNVYLHVGLPKSGTSYVQKVLTANKTALKRAGLLFPGETWGEQVRAVQDIRGMTVPRGRRALVDGAWERLVTEAATWSGDVIISMEWLASARPEHIRTVIDDFGGAKVHVIFTVRDLARTVPAAWQEFVQNRDEWSWEEFLESVVTDDRTPGSPGKRFWAQQDLAKLLGRWTSVIPAQDVHVVTLPHPGADQGVLWQRMCAVLGGAYEDCQLGGLGSNTSLGLESAELMRRLNRAAREGGLPESTYHRVFKHGVAKRLLAERSARESKLVLPVAHHEWARRQATHQIEAVEKSGVKVVGDLADLQPVLGTAGGRQPDEVTDAELLDLALGALVGMARRSDTAGQARLRDRVRRFEANPGRAALKIYARKVRTAAAGHRPGRRQEPGVDSDPGARGI